jgi:hypothetical protein
MFGSTILDVAVGLIFFYFLLSMIATHINEFIAARMKWRANDLEAQIRHMLGDPNLANKVLENPMITSIASKGNKPAYIPPNTFALALFDAFVPEGETATVLDKVHAGVTANMATNKAAGAVLKIVDHANGDMKVARAGAETWFNASMDRLSGAYKRRMQLLTLVVSFIMISILGADTLAIADSLYKEPSLRSAVSGAAAAAPTNPQIQPSQANQSGSASAVTSSVDTFLKSGFPLGWTAFPTDLVGWPKKILGLLITALAVSLGAPFWYNILKEVGSLRSSGPVPSTVPTSDNLSTTQIPATATAPATVTVTAQPPSHP